MSYRKKKLKEMKEEVRSLKFSCEEREKTFDNKKLVMIDDVMIAVQVDFNEV